MLCQTGEGCCRLVLDCMGRRVQKLKNAADPPRLDEVFLVSPRDMKRVDYSPCGSNQPCNLTGLRRLWPIAATRRDFRSGRAPALHTPQPSAWRSLPEIQTRCACMLRRIRRPKMFG
jgi:hypothetical protein